MRIRQWLRDAWDNVFMPTEEKRGDDDSVRSEEHTSELQSL